MLDKKYVIGNTLSNCDFYNPFVNYDKDFKNIAFINGMQDWIMNFKTLQATYLYYILNLTYKEVSEIMNIPQSTLSKRYVDYNKVVESCKMFAPPISTQKLKITVDII